MRYLALCLVLLGCLARPAAAAYVPFPGAATPTHIIGLPSDNATSVKATAGVVYAIFAANPGANTAYLKFYDSASVPNCGATAVAASFPIQGSAVFSIALPYGIQFTNGIGVCLVSGVADNDDTAVAGGIVIDLFWN